MFKPTLEHIEKMIGISEGPKKTVQDFIQMILDSYQNNNHGGFCTDQVAHWFKQHPHSTDFVLFAETNGNVIHCVIIDAHDHVIPESDTYNKMKYKFPPARVDSSQIFYTSDVYYNIADVIPIQQVFHSK